MLTRVLDAWDESTHARDSWYGYSAMKQEERIDAALFYPHKVKPSDE